MRNISFPSCLFMLILCLSSRIEAKVIMTTPEGDLPAGSIIMTIGDVFRITPTGKKKRVRSPGPFFPGETLKTKNNSAVEVQFIDGSVLNLGPRSHAVLEEYAYDSNSESGKITVRVASGVYRFVKGKMRSFKPNDIHLKLPSGIVGIQDATVLAQVSDHRSLAILWQSEGETRISHQMVVRNKVGNQYYETIISKLGFGCMIKDKSLPPTPESKILDSDIDWIISQFTPQKGEMPAAEPEDEQAPELAIQAIVYDKEARVGGKFIVVDGQLYEEGAMINDFEVLSIEPENVKIKALETGEVKTIGIQASSAAEMEKTKEEIHVVSIFYDTQNRKNSFAYINGTLSREGDALQAFMIHEIKPYGVTIQKKGAAEPEVVPLEKTQSAANEQALTPLFLQSIAYDSSTQKSFATINGKSYRQGELVEGYPLVQISEEAVWIRRTPSGGPEKILLEKGQEESGDERPKIEIQIILYNEREPKKSQVAIMSSLYKSGDLVEGYEILEIHKTYIRVRKKLRQPWRSYVIWELK